MNRRHSRQTPRSKDKPIRYKKYGLGGVIGTAAGAGLGAFVGQPHIGAMVGKVIGGQFDGTREEESEITTTGSGYLANGGSMRGGKAKNMGSQGYIMFGDRHDAGGIKMRDDIEVEGGETVDSKGDGYVFSDRLQIPGEGKTFAQKHQELIEMNASHKAIDDLKKVQERVSGRTRGPQNSEWGQPGMIQFATGGKMVKPYTQGEKVKKITSQPVRGTVQSQPVRSRVEPSPVRSTVKSQPVSSNTVVKRSAGNRSNIIKRNYADGGSINIKDSKKGTFTKAAKKRGMGVQEFAGKVLNNKDQYSSAMVKKANFARNASKWNKKAYGGSMGYTKYANGGPYDPTKLRTLYQNIYTVDPSGNTYAPRSGPATNIPKGLGTGKPLGGFKALGAGKTAKGLNTLNTISKGVRAARLAGPISIGATLGYEVPSAIMGESPVEAYNRMQESFNARDRSAKNLRNAQRTSAEGSGVLKNEYQYVPFGISPFPEPAGASPSTNESIGINSGLYETDLQKLQNTFPAKPRRARGSSSQAPPAGPSEGSPPIGRSTPSKGPARKTNPIATRKLPTTYESIRSGNTAVEDPTYEPYNERTSTDAEATGTDWAGLVQYAPTALNLATGLFGKNKTKEATQVRRSKVGQGPIDYNINPQLEQSGANYRAILSNPNASANERLAALAGKNRADSGAFATKENTELQMREQRNARQAGLDANRNAQQASMDERQRQDVQRAEAQLGITGNLARKSLSEISQILQQKKKDKNMTERDKQLIKYLESIYGTDPAGTGGQQPYQTYGSTQ